MPTPLTPIPLGDLLDAARKCHNTGDLAQAESMYRQILLHVPDDPDALHLLGMVFAKTDRYAAGAQLVSRAITLAPTVPQLYSNLGTIYDDMKQYDLAIENYRKALQMLPHYPEAHNNLGNSLKDSGRLAESIPEYRRAVELDPKYSLAMHNLAAALYYMGDAMDAVRWCKKALEISPDLGLVHGTLGMILLTLGDFPGGWEEYEWRFKVPELALPTLDASKPRWMGEDLNGRTILLRSEQGFGDTIQMARYLPMIKKGNGKIILECQPALIRQFSAMPGIDQIIPEGFPDAPAPPLPPHDIYCPMLSLPRIFRTDLTSIPAPIPYVFAYQEMIDQWAKIVPHDERMKVGLVWAGRPEHENDWMRTMTLAQLAPLAAVKNVWYASLQKGPGANEAKHPPAGMELVDFGAQLNDFSETAGLIANLDLIVSVDTGVVHLAGAMGKPAWVLLQFMPDWRWMLNRFDSPWYPTVRLFRQPQREDWASTVAALAVSLQAAANSHQAV